MRAGRRGRAGPGSRRNLATSGGAAGRFFALRVEAFRHEEVRRAPRFGRCAEDCFLRFLPLAALRPSLDIGDMARPVIGFRQLAVGRDFGELHAEGVRGEEAAELRHEFIERVFRAAERAQLVAAEPVRVARHVGPLMEEDAARRLNIFEPHARRDDDPIDDRDESTGRAIALFMALLLCTQSCDSGTYRKRARRPRDGCETH